MADERRRLRRVVFKSIVDLRAAINRCFTETNDPRPFRWTAHPDRIMGAVKRGQEVSESMY